MVKFSKLGAAALALALSVVFVCPTQALAASKPAKVVELDKQGNDTIGTTTDVTLVGEYVGTDDYSDVADEQGQAKLVAAGLAAGWLKTAEDDNHEYSRHFYNGTGYQEYYYQNGYSFEMDEYGIRSGSKWVYTHKVKSTIYKNNSTGKSSIKSSDLYDEDAQQVFASGVRVKKGEITYLKVPLKNGDVNITNIKSSKKKIVKAKRFTKLDYVYTTNNNLETWDNELHKDSEGNYYYYTSAGKKVVVSKDDVEYGVAKNTNGSYASVYIELTPTKVGKSDLSFDIVDRDGKVTGSVKTTIYSMASTDAFTKVTYAGKSLLTDYSEKNNINYGRKTTDTEWNVTNKKSGKLVVKMNKNYQVKSIEVGTLYTEPLTAESSNNYENSVTGTTVYDHKVDLNGDGDTLDTVNGISESDVTYKYTTVKSGRKIKLGTVGWDQAYTKTSKSKNDSSGNPYEANAEGKAIEISSKNGGHNLYAPTIIKVTYYDKLTKTYGRKEFSISVRVKK